MENSFVNSLILEYEKMGKTFPMNTPWQVKHKQVESTIHVNREHKGRMADSHLAALLNYFNEPDIPLEHPFVPHLFQ